MATTKKHSDLKAKLPKIREEINAALLAVAKRNGLTSLRCANATYDPAGGNFTIKVDGVDGGGLDKQAAAYNAWAGLLDLPPLGTTFVAQTRSFTTIGVNTTGTKVICRDSDGKTYQFLVEAVLRLAGSATKSPEEIRASALADLRGEK